MVRNGGVEILLSQLMFPLHEGKVLPNASQAQQILVTLNLSISVVK